LYSGNAEYNRALMLASYENKVKESERLQEMAVSKFESSLKWVPDNEATLTLYGVDCVVMC
jgi:hypothetical protein